MSLSRKDLAHHFNVNWLVIPPLTPWRGFRALEGKGCGWGRDPRGRRVKGELCAWTPLGLQGRNLPS